jgi:glucan phosphoethanolaminetransferase (alkaline phosphatase superfamily)
MPDGTPANQNETPENRSNRNDCVNKLYNSLSGEIRELERNFISILVPVISALGVYGIGLRAYLQQPCEQNLIFFTITTGAFILLLIIVWFASNIFAYTHRSNQVILSRIENIAGLYGNNGILPQGWNLNDKLRSCNSTDPPEIYKFFKLVSFMIGVIGIVLYILIGIYYEVIEIKIWTVIVVVILLAVLALIFLILKFRWGGWKILKKLLKDKSYSDKLKDIANNIGERLCQ